MKLRNPVRDVRTIKTLLETAETEARDAGETEPKAEHLLLAALALPDGTARRAFERAGADPDALREAIESAHSGALTAVGIDASASQSGDAAPPQAPNVYRSSPSAETVFQEASKLARAERGTQLAGAHVVIAVTELQHGTATRALEALGVDRAALADAAREELAAT